MTSEQLRAYLRDLQKSPYKWPNDYFAWEKPDKTLFLLGINSDSFYKVLKYEYQKHFKSYGAGYYNLDPKDPHPTGDKSHLDSVDRLIEEVSQYRFLGSWRDPDILMEHPNGTGKVLACGRWELAKDHIPNCRAKMPLSEQISGARKKVQPVNAGRGGEGPVR